jgi:hypothetical protein
LPFVHDGCVSNPAELPFVLDVPDDGVRRREFSHGDVYARETDPRPTIVFVSGPAADDPRAWPMYTGYGRLAVQHGVNAVVAKLDYPHMGQAEEVAGRLPEIVAAARELPEVDEDRIALWAFSGGGLLVDRWLECPPSWLRVVGLTYPVFGASPRLEPGLPVVLTRAALERPKLLAVVDEFIAGNDVEVVHAAGGHAFDLLDHTENSRVAVTTAMGTVCAHLT